MRLLRFNLAALQLQVIFYVRFNKNLFIGRKQSPSCVCGETLPSCGLMMLLRLRNTRDSYLQF